MASDLPPAYSIICCASRAPRKSLQQLISMRFSRTISSLCGLNSSLVTWKFKSAKKPRKSKTRSRISISMYRNTGFRMNGTQMMLTVRTAFVRGGVTRALVPCTSYLLSCPHSFRLKLIELRYSCAAINGIDPAIVSRANEIAFLSARGENIVAACAVLSSEEMQDLEEAVRALPCLKGKKCD